ncbi:MAG: lipid-A-disaccharide synthase [Candidatus Sericytochromatia bacterium]|nr:lipid-A-disaccharide synthase [Candidatus Sericytochromatia bacterium]
MTQRPRLFLSAGEVSGDRYGAALAAFLRSQAPGVELRGLGGSCMAAAGVALVDDVTPVSAVGLLEQLPAVARVLRALGAARRVLAAWRPDVVVLIDFQGANMRLARAARELGIPTVYWLLPQAWLWGLPGELARVARAVDQLIAVLPPEAAAYRDAGGAVVQVGHPLLDLLAELPPHRPAPGPLVALLPGSRAAEIRALLPAFLGAAARVALAHEDARFVLPLASGHLASSVRAALAGCALPVTVLEGEEAPGWAHADVALVASGTAVLEAACRDVPCVAAYRVARPTAWLARRLLRGPHVTLPNILLGRSVVPECLQDEARPARLAAELEALLADPGRREAQRAGFAEVRGGLGGPGGVAAAARVVLAAAGLWLEDSCLPR